LRAAVGLQAITFTSHSLVHNIKALKCSLYLPDVTTHSQRELCVSERELVRIETSARCYLYSTQSDSNVQKLDSGRGRLINLDYNKLKVPILEHFVEGGEMDSASVCRRLSESNEIVIDIHALRMALMRYYRQGLLKRERSGGVFKYTISQRGVQRLRWLQQQG
jgi:hypothetical protein